MKRYKLILKKSEAVWYAEQLDKSREICSDYLFQEAIIDINKYKKILEYKLKDLEITDLYGTIDNLNKIFEKDKIKFKTNSYIKKIGAKTFKDNNEIFIEIHFPIKMDIFENKDIFKTIINIIGHESIHRMQELIANFENRMVTKSKKLDQINYLSNQHEIMAYSWQIVNEFKLHGESENNIKKLLKTNNFIKLKFSKILRNYHETFKPESKVLKKLYRYMFDYLEK